MSTSLTVITTAGNKLLANVVSGGGIIEFYNAQTGSGDHSETWTRTDLQARTALISPENTYGFSKINKSTTGYIFISFLASNYDSTAETSLVDEAYSIREIGIFARKKGTSDTPILFAISAFKDDEDTGAVDILPVYDLTIGEVQYLENMVLYFTDSDAEVSIAYTGAAYLAEDGEALEERVEDLEDGLISLDTTASSGTDYELYTAITALSWASDVIES